jgi:hypothetical protein
MASEPMDPRANLFWRIAMLFVLLSGCSHVATEPEGTPILRFEHASYDGRSMGGLVLLGAEGGPITLDRRLVEGVSIDVGAATACDTGLPLKRTAEDAFVGPPAESDLLKLWPGYWYGHNVSLRIFEESSGPPCVVVSIVYRKPFTSGERSGDPQLRVRLAR